jgi:DNA-directed RNA polymerase specialized sigma24 family protein
MTTDSGPGHSRPDPGLSAIMSERRQLINLAYRLLGSLADAEDAVQETYARWYAMSWQQQEAIESAGAWLTKVASRICLDLLGSARARRERYVGDWIPEPLPEPTEWTTGRPGGTTADPADRVTLDESVNMAFLVVLESMTPRRVHPARRLPLLLRRSSRHHRPYPGGMPPARLLSPPPHPRAAGSRGPDSPPGRHRPGLQKGMGSQGHRRPHRPARPRRHDDRRRRRPGPRRAPTDRRRRADRALPGRPRRQGTQPDDPGAYGQRSARSGGPARRRHRDGVRVRRRRRQDQAHLGSTQPRQAPALDDRLTRVAIPSGPLRAAAAQPPLPSQAGWATTAPPEKGGPARSRSPSQTHNEVIGAPPGTRLARTSRAPSRRSGVRGLDGCSRRVTCGISSSAFAARWPEWLANVTLTGARISVMALAIDVSGALRSAQQRPPGPRGARAEETVAFGDPPCRRHHQGERGVRGGLGQHVRGVAGQDAVPGAGVHVDVVEAHGVVRHDLEPGPAASRNSSSTRSVRSVIAPAFPATSVKRSRRLPADGWLCPSAGRPQPGLQRQQAGMVSPVRQGRAQASSQRHDHVGGLGSRSGTLGPSSTASR